ncbi:MULTISPECIES: RDD family protein [unclassified Acinetobacter]|uniref:RDD family protein n=1 Tax=unclassified Acinetobacter TaxID=196816 RepID=UPI002934FD4A|nr:MULTISPECIES: RDD family protein [unclassified Acinetobacter]WOE32401.1 RDD family protein [Acinetobacter sp. SAAs470]WOE37875.1 RDD family protein [Acinetobacter sp. SAAs474]
MQIYLARNNQQAGPYTLDQLNQMLASQQVLLTDLVWHQGMTEWKALGELTQGKFIYQPEGFTAPVATAPTVQNAPTHQSTQTTTPSQSKNNAQTTLASITSRFFAKVIDLLLWIPALMIMSLFFKADQIPQLVALQQRMQSATTADQATQLQHQVFQLIPMEAWQAAGLYIFIMLIVQAMLIVKSGQSIGKRLLKIQIVDAESQQPTTLFRAFTLRSIVFIFLNVLLFPFITFFDFVFAISKKRQTLHDKLAKTIVIKK